MWLEEYESSPPARPNIVGILEQLQDEAGTWDPTSRPLALQTPMEQTANRMSFHSPEPGLCAACPKITAMSSVEPSRLTYQLVGHKGVCPSLSSRRNAGLSRIPDDLDVDRKSTL